MYSCKYPHLAQPLKLGHSGITLKNRVNSAPQWNFMATYDNHITRECVEAVIPFAKGGSAVVAMGSGFINKELPAACHHVPGISDPHKIQQPQLFSQDICGKIRHGTEIIQRCRK